MAANLDTNIYINYLALLDGEIKFLCLWEEAKSAYLMMLRTNIKIVADRISENVSYSVFTYTLLQEQASKYSPSLIYVLSYTLKINIQLIPKK